MEDAVSHGWEAVKAAHSVILTSLEAGTFTWADEYRMSDKRRSAITRASKEASVAPPVSASKFSNSRGQGRQGQSGQRNFASGKKSVKPCIYFNNGACSKRGDHEEINVIYRHACSYCMSGEHVRKDCSFL
jgi:hypothetical protein